MTIIPKFFVKRFYVKNSLRNTPDGCELDVRNSVRAGSLIGVGPVTIGPTNYPPNRVVLLGLNGGAPLPAASITPDAPQSIAGGVTVTLRVSDIKLPPGKHSVTLRVNTREAGEVEMTLCDTVRPALEARRAAQEPASPEAAPDSAVARPIKVAMIGAGSAMFARQLMSDLLVTPGLERGSFALVDIDSGRLELAHGIADRLIAAAGRAWTVEASTDRLALLAGCDFVINFVEVAGLANVRADYEIPLKYGVDQCIGDTIGPGGLFKLLRTGPAWLDIVRDVARLAPGAVVLNYTNPMSALTLAALRATELAVVGLCHSVQHTSRQLADYLDLPYEELRWQCAGINHLAWFTELTYQGEDMYPRLLAAANDPDLYDADPVRFEVMRHFGAFVTESSGHLSEYLPYFRKRPDISERYLRGGYRGESGFYANHWPQWRAAADESIRDVLEGRIAIHLQRSHEYASVIIEAIALNRPAVIHGNVRNDGLIDNLPAGGCVEVPVLVDSTGLHPIRFGPLPAQMAALDAAHMYVHELMVQAILERDRVAARHALLLDPLTAAVLSPAEIGQLFDELWAAQQAHLW